MMMMIEMKMGDMKIKRIQKAVGDENTLSYRERAMVGEWPQSGEASDDADRRSTE